MSSPSVRTTGADHGSSNPDRKSTRLNSSHITISYAVFCLKKKKKITLHDTEGGFLPASKQFRQYATIKIRHHTAKNSTIPTSTQLHIWNQLLSSLHLFNAI